MGVIITKVGGFYKESAAVDSNLGALTETMPTSDTASSGINGRLQRLCTLATALTTDIGALTETAPSTDTASSGINGRLQRLCVLMTSLIAKVPAELTSAGGTKTEIIAAFDRSHYSYVDITCPNNANQYAINDAIGDTGGSAILIFTNIGRANKPLLINSIEVFYNSGTLPTLNGALQLHLYNASPTAIADNAAWKLLSADRKKYLGVILITAPVLKGDTGYVRLNNLNLQVFPIASSIYGILTTDAAITRAEVSTSITVGLHSLEI